jgi:hypothetical protein
MVWKKVAAQIAGGIEGATVGQVKAAGSTHTVRNWNNESGHKLNGDFKQESPLLG